ncbi:MAG: hypothetical protein IID28_02480 [Planctomycetes bacterium]|nr:hypothetical protein [Planctomycetota bacterium]
MNESDAHLDDLIREHYESRRPRPGRLAALEEMLVGPAVATKTRRTLFAGSKHTTVLLAACVTLSAAAGALLALAGVYGFGGLKPTTEREPAADIIAVQFYAEWCKPSQIVTRRVDALQEASADKRVLFLRLDLTDDTRREQAHLLMASLGCGHIWDTQCGRTGELLLVDGHARRPITTLNQDNDAEQMIVALTQALAQAAVP